MSEHLPTWVKLNKQSTKGQSVFLKSQLNGGRVANGPRLSGARQMLLLASLRNTCINHRFPDVKNNSERWLTARHTGLWVTAARWKAQGIAHTWKGLLNYMRRRWKSRSNVGQSQWAPKSISCTHNVLSSNRLWGGFPGRAVPGVLGWYQQVVVAVRIPRGEQDSPTVWTASTKLALSEGKPDVGIKSIFLLLTPDTVGQPSSRQESQDIVAHCLQNEMQPAKWLIFTDTSKAFDVNTDLILWVMINLEIKPKTLLWKLQNSLVRCPSRWRACCTSLQPWFWIPGTTEKAKPSNGSLWSQHWEAETGGSEGLAQAASPAESANSRFRKRPCLK